MNDNKQKSVINSHKSHRNMPLKTNMNFCNVCLFAIQIITVTIHILHYAFQKCLNYFNICILSLLLHTYDTSSCLYFSLLNISKKLPEKRTSRRCTICLYIVVIKGSAVYIHNIFDDL